MIHVKVVLILGPDAEPNCTLLTIDALTIDA